MPLAAQTDSLTSFQRNAKAHMRKLRRTGQPEVLTVKGEPTVVVQDAAAYEAMVQRLDELEAVTGIQRGVESAKQGRGRPVREFMAAMRRKHRIPEPGLMSHIYTVIIQAEAEANMEDAYQWLVENAPEYAADWFNGLLDEFKRLEQFPEKFPLAPENRFGVFDYEVRQMLYGKGFWKYRVLYFIEGDKVQIVHVRHGARRWLGTAGEKDEETGEE